MIILQNANGDYTAIKAQDVQIVDTLGSLQTLSFNFVGIQKNEVATKMMLPMTTVLIPENNQKYRILTVNTDKLGKYQQYNVAAVHIAKDMHNYYRSGKLEKTQSLQSCLDYLFKNTPFKYSIKDQFPNYSFSEGFGEGYVDDLLNQLSQDFEFEYYFDNYNLYISKKIGNDNSFVFIDNTNCSKISTIENYESITTRIVGQSNPKQDDNSNSTTTEYTQKIEYISPLVEKAKWNVIDATPVNYDENLNRDTLLSRMKKALHDYPDIQYTVDNINFKRFSKIKNNIQIGNSGFLRDRFGIDIKVRISSYTWYPQDDTKNSNVTFGNIMLDPITWQVKNHKAYEQNVNLGKNENNGIQVPNQNPTQTINIEYGVVNLSLNVGICYVNFEVTKLIANTNLVTIQSDFVPKQTRNGTFIISDDQTYIINYCVNNNLISIGTITDLKGNIIEEINATNSKISGIFNYLI
nr:phage tail protein [uncultured Ligilactobacillus sp.]